MEPKGPVVEQRFARLSHHQWEQTVVDLFGLAAPTGLSAGFAADPLGGKAFDNYQAVLGVGPALWNDYQTAAETVAAQVTGDPQLLAHLLPSGPMASAREKARAFIQSFGLRAYRRPLLEIEVTERQDLFDQGPALYPELDPFVAGARLNIAAFLQSPNFIYRADLSPSPDHGPVVPLSGWEVASRLSYALWNSMPDQELFRAAGAGELGTKAGLDAEVERMISAPRAVDTLGHFFTQLYQTSQYQHLSKDVTLYPNFTPDIAVDMQGELARFAGHVYQGGGGLRELLTSPTSFVTPRLGAIYGLPADALGAADAQGFSRVELDPSQRSGLLTRAGFLAWKGTDSQPNTIQRGVFIIRRIICQPLGDPPAAAQGAVLGAQTTNRQRIDALTGPGTCGAGCHGRFINAAGFAFEHFGALGEYRLQDGGSAIDSSATFPFASGAVSYRDATDFSLALAGSLQSHACFAHHLLEFLLGREHTADDDALVDDLARRSLAGASTRELVVTALEGEVLRNQYTVLVEP